MLIQQAMEEQRRREREAAERRLYESRRNMWDAEKRLKSAEKALAHEDEREEQAKRVRLQEREDKAARRAGCLLYTSYPPCGTPPLLLSKTPACGGQSKLPFSANFATPERKGGKSKH